MPFTTSTLNAMLNAAHGKTTYTAPTTFYLGFSTTTPTIAGTGVTEPVGNGYQRTPVTGAYFGLAANGSITNTAEIPFATATGAWGTVTHVVAFSAATGGTVLWYAPITSQAIAANTVPKLSIGAATSTLA